ncbi:LOW QUALITY PROTEIN: thiosulfate sulfurtransferase-like [Eucyclogobius newberryi]|uniref:LOW QUALITY PROTEIN: thiosulfate sulfurtransferase-like n=1 Tax=Eucyclogobius newberryi TaxID=166745 RepID=UPI003B5C797F
MGMQSQALVTSRWLGNMVKRNLVGPSLRILDTSWFLPMMNRDGKKEFAQTHIPGASHFDIDDCSDRTSQFDHTLPSEELFSDYVGHHGISNDSHVIVYDASDFGAFSCTRVWWMFRLFGQPKVSVLNGGFRSWVKEGHPVTDQCSRPQPVKFKAKMNREWVKSFEDITENITTPQYQVVDVRPYARFLGKEAEPREGNVHVHVHVPTT